METSRRKARAGTEPRTIKIWARTLNHCRVWWYNACCNILNNANMLGTFYLVVDLGVKPVLRDPVGFSVLPGHQSTW